MRAAAGWPAMLLGACSQIATTTAPARGAQIVLDEPEDGAQGDAIAVFGGAAFGVGGATAPPCSVFGPPDELSTFQAGQLDITGVPMAFSMAPLGSDPAVQYVISTAVSIPLFNPGETIRVVAQGGTGPDDLPGFQQSVDAPAPITGLTMPATLSIDHATAIRWDAGGATSVWVSLFDPDRQATSTILCQVPDTGEFDLPVAALALFSPTPSRAMLVFARVDASIQFVGDTAVQLMAIVGNPAEGPIPLGP